MTDLGGVTRQFSMKGATHPYSSLPFMLTPADLYSVKNNPAHKAALLGCNIYLIARRPLWVWPEIQEMPWKVALCKGGTDEFIGQPYVSD